MMTRICCQIPQINADIKNKNFMYALQFFSKSADHYKPWIRSEKKRWWAPAQFDRGYEPLLKRKGTYVYTKEGTVESPLQIQEV